MEFPFPKVGKTEANHFFVQSSKHFLASPKNLTVDFLGAMLPVLVQAVFDAFVLPSLSDYGQKISLQWVKMGQGPSAEHLLHSNCSSACSSPQLVKAVSLRASCFDLASTYHGARVGRWTVTMEQLLCSKSLTNFNSLQFDCLYSLNHSCHFCCFLRFSGFSASFRHTNHFRQ